jgi:REP element-mobilizing transposase RayT
VQPASRDVRAFYATAQQALAYPLLLFASEEFAAVAAALGEAIRARNYTCYACAVMPDHVHLLVRKHRDAAEEMIDYLQSDSRLRLSAENLRTTDHPTWTRGGWKVFLDHPDGVRRTIRYIEVSPVKWRLPKQSWTFVVRYDNWPLHVGHSSNSPYVRALRAAGRYPR